MIAKNIINILEEFAPPSYQESYDNSGMIIGSLMQEIVGISISLDVTEEVIDEAILHGHNMIVAHHPLIFSGIKKINGDHWVDKCIIKAIKNDIAIYAIHTNLDNVSNGVNKKICEKLKLQNTKVLSPKSHTLTKLTTFIPKDSTSDVLQSLYDAGAGQIGNYDHCSFTVEGRGSFRAGDSSNPTIGKHGIEEKVIEDKVELIFEDFKTAKIVEALKSKHPYEEVAYYLHKLENQNQNIGSGMIGELAKPMKSIDFLNLIKQSMKTEIIRHTSICKEEVQKIAVCGGSGSFLLNNALHARADIFISGDFKYHEFFEADNKIIIADIGHYESEQFTKELIFDFLSEKLTNIALRLTETKTNPLKYL